MLGFLAKDKKDKKNQQKSKKYKMTDRLLLTISADILDIENPYRAQLFKFFSILALNRAKLGVFLESDVWE